MNLAVPGYIHDAFVYSTDEEMVTGAVHFLQEGIDADEAAVVVCSERNAEIVARALGAEDRLALLPQPDVYHRVPDAIIAFQHLIERQLASGAHRVRVVAEVDFGASEATWSEWARFESVVNMALAEYPLWNVCIYDTRVLPEAVIATAERTHPNVRTGASRSPSSQYVEPLKYLSQPRAWEPFPMQAGLPAIDLNELTDLAQLRHGLAEALAAGKLARDGVDDMVIAVSEIATNAIMYGGPPVNVRLWAEDGRAICTVTDHGPGIDNPFAGYVPAHGSDLTRGGMGLWMARRLCDQVDLHKGPDGFTVRLVMG
jgi:anti-sigma regulatory factor (Ser/Thr protein kinase)